MAESKKYPSYVDSDEDKGLLLIDVLGREGQAILGHQHLERFGPVVPLLPKTLNVCELLSVQAHPLGQIELYIVIDAAPKASLRLGFSQDVKRDTLKESMIAGRRIQEELVSNLRQLDLAEALQSIIAPWLRQRVNAAEDIVDMLDTCFKPEYSIQRRKERLKQLHATYWSVLDAMNDIVVQPGDVILNATPERLLADATQIPSAEIHALGNPEQRELLLLEIRCPAVTYRAWDHVRFPLRDVHIDQALTLVNCHKTSPEEFIIAPTPHDESRERLVESHAFVVDRYSLQAEQTTSLSQASTARTFHVITGSVSVEAGDEQLDYKMEQGQSALIGVSANDVHLRSHSNDTQLICATWPDRAGGNL